MMGIALGGLGVLSLKLPHRVSLEHFVDLPTLFPAAFLLAIFALIAYFSNPSEASLRTFLTELSFRHHLSRLSEVHESDDSDDTRLAHLINYKGSRKKDGSAHKPDPHAHDSPVVFHFANKASVSLRTPGYRFCKFGIFTIAFVSPTELAFTGTGTQPPRVWSNPARHGACYIGAFGHWWPGFKMRTQSRPVRIAIHDHATPDLAHCDSPSLRAEDRDRDRDREQILTRPPRPHAHSHARAHPRTKAALRERLLSHGSPPRPTTPPPLPKSASLPLHGPPPAPPLLTSTAPVSTATPSPALADLSAQVEAVRVANAELQTQLASLRPPSHPSLEAAVEIARETKRNEDAGRAVIKSRIKTLDDSRRQAEGRKREAERRLKAATAARDGTTDRIERLRRDIGKLLDRMAADAARVAASAEDTAKERSTLTDALAEKHAEITDAEGAVNTLATRTRELEDAVAEETARLEALKARPRRTRMPADTSAWPPPLVPPPPPPPPLRGLPSPRLGTGNGIVNTQSNVNGSTSQEFAFSPFEQSLLTISPLSPVSAGLLPSSLVQSMENPRESLFGHDRARSVLQREHSSYEQDGAGYQSPPALYSTGNIDGYASTSAPTSPIDAPSFINHFDAQRAVFPPPRLPAHPPSPPIAAPTPLTTEDDDFALRPRRWFSGREKGLNPTAKVFTLPHSRRLPASDVLTGSDTSLSLSLPDDATPSHPHPHPNNNNNNNNNPSVPTSTFFAALHSAFAPSPAEREVFQRTLGDASLERVSSRGSAGGSAHSSPMAPSARAWDATLSVPSHRTASFNPWPAKEGA